MRLSASLVPVAMAIVLIAMAWRAVPPSTPEMSASAVMADSAAPIPAIKASAYRPVILPPPPTLTAAPVSLTPAASNPSPASSAAFEPPAPKRVVQVPTVVPDAKDRTYGARLLSELEAGDGPVLELTWPDRRDDKDRLARHLTRCAGLVAALLSGGRLWRASDPPGTAWLPDRRHFSGIMRRARSMSSGSTATVIKARHGLVEGDAVALVTRAFDARLLGGLARLVGGVRLAKGHVAGRYALAGNRLVLEAIKVDGTTVSGRVDLGAVGRCGG